MSGTKKKYAYISMLGGNEDIAKAVLTYYTKGIDADAYSKEVKAICKDVVVYNGYTKYAPNAIDNAAAEAIAKFNKKYGKTPAICAKLIFIDQFVDTMKKAKPTTELLETIAEVKAFAQTQKISYAGYESAKTAATKLMKDLNKYFVNEDDLATAIKCQKKTFTYNAKAYAVYNITLKMLADDPDGFAKQIGQKSFDSFVRVIYAYNNYVGIRNAKRNADSYKLFMIENY